MMTASFYRILLNAVTQIRLQTDHHNWDQAGQTTVIAAPPNTKIGKQEVYDDHTILLLVQCSVQGAITFTDPVNNEAITMTVWTAAQFSTEKETPMNDDTDFENETPVPDGYWDQQGSVGLGGGLI
jgi:hypothetical protein